MADQITSRWATSVSDLVAASDLLTAAWAAGSPRVAAARGDLDWWLCQAWPAGPADRLRLWESAGRTVAWSWHDGGSLDYHAWTGDEARDTDVSRAILEWSIDAAAARGSGEGSVLTWAADDDEATRALLRELGFECLEGPVAGPAREHRSLSQFQRTVDDASPIDDPPLASGYRIRHVTGPEELEARVEVHRAAFAPSRKRIEKYRTLVSLPDYRFEDDLVVEAPDGSLAAFAMAWWDPVARVGELEPVGTDPRHQRRGLGRALLCHALRRYQSLGAILVQVFSDADNAASEGLYQSVGFDRKTFHRRYRHG